MESAVARRLRLASVAAALLVFALIVRWVMVAPSTARIIAGAILAVPFVVGAPFLRAGHRRAYAWLTLALAPPLVLGLTEAVADPTTRAWSAAFVFVLLGMFVVLVGYLRATRASWSG